MDPILCPIFTRCVSFGVSHHSVKIAVFGIIGIPKRTKMDGYPLVVWIQQSDLKFFPFSVGLLQINSKFHLIIIDIFGVRLYIS